jgi:hypothetical protein
MNTIIDANKTPVAIGLYSQTRVRGNSLFISRQISLKSQNEKILEATTAEQPSQITKNPDILLRSRSERPVFFQICKILPFPMKFMLKVVLEAAESSFEKAIKSCVAVKTLPGNAVAEPAAEVN